MNLEILKQHWKWYYKHSAKDIILNDWTNLKDDYDDYEERITNLENA